MLTKMLYFLQLMDILITTYPAALKMEIFKLTQNFLDLISTHASNGKRALKVSSFLTQPIWLCFIELPLFLAIDRIRQYSFANFYRDC